MATKGSALKGALAAAPRGGGIVTSLPVGPRPVNPSAGLRRLSPGVYRSPQGQLVNSQGGALPGQPQSQQFRALPAAYDAANALAGVGAGAAATNWALSGGAPEKFQHPATRPPAPLGPVIRPPAPLSNKIPPMAGRPVGDGMMYAGGSPNFDETTGQYRQPYQQQIPPGQMFGGYASNVAGGFGAGAGAGLGGQVYGGFAPNRNSFAPGVDTGFGDYLRQRAIGMPQVSPEQAAAMAAKANYGVPPTSQQQAFNQQQEAGYSAARMQPNGTIVY